MAVETSTFVVEYRDSNKRRPHLDIRWRAYGLEGKAKPVWTIDLEVEVIRKGHSQQSGTARQKSLATRAFTNRTHVRKEVQLEAPGAGTQYAEHEAKVKKALDVGHIIGSVFSGT